jgi:hypothetical protein
MEELLAGTSKFHRIMHSIAVGLITLTLTVACLVGWALLLPGCGGDADISGIVGDPCGVDMECADGICLTELGPDSDQPVTFVEGYCTAPCYYDENYVMHGCPGDSLCLIYDDYTDTIPAESYCFATGCQTDWDCRDENYVCRHFFVDLFSVGACIPYIPA